MTSWFHWRVSRVKSVSKALDLLLELADFRRLCKNMSEELAAEKLPCP